ncbi:hypothetical protein D2Q93_09880 [Alicyclobacillaceae bacterium I2511]|nr:hypothetical protein D2Q93_09880 [Alicyclobacillaceae bacterium I2511]
MAESQRICDRVAIIQGGHLVSVGDSNNLGGQDLSTVRLMLSDADPDKIGIPILPRDAQLHILVGNEWRATVTNVALRVGEQRAAYRVSILSVGL